MKRIIAALGLLMLCSSMVYATDVADVTLRGRVWRVDRYYGASGLSRVLIWVRTEGTTSNLKVFPVQCAAPLEEPCLTPATNLFDCAVTTSANRLLLNNVTSPVTAYNLETIQCTSATTLGRCIDVSGYLYNGSVDPGDNHVVVVGKSIDDASGTCSTPQV